MRKLTPTAVCNIRHAVLIEAKPATEVAKKHKVSPTTVRAIARGVRYRDVPQAQAIPQFENYLAYPDGRVWSETSQKFLKPRLKGSSRVKYYDLRNAGERKSIRVSSLKTL